MKILFLNSGIPGFSQRYAYDIYTTLLKDFQCVVRQASPRDLSRRLIREFKPDILLVVHGTYTSPSLVRFARSLGVTTLLWLVEDPYEIDFHRGEMVESYDFVFTNEQKAVTEYLRSGVYYLPWCCNPYIHKRMIVSPSYYSDLCFVGMGFPNRIKIINAVAPVLKKLKVRLIGDWDKWGELDPDLKDFVIPVIDDFWEVQKYYNGARINLNIHRDPVDPPSGNERGVGAVSPNDRTFALAGCGCFQLVDKTRPGLWDCFTEDEEIVGFSDPDDLARKIEEYLSRPVRRVLIGEAAQKRAYSQHTYKHRLAEVFKKIGIRPVPVRSLISPNSTQSANKLLLKNKSFSFRSEIKIYPHRVYATKG